MTDELAQALAEALAVVERGEKPLPTAMPRFRSVQAGGLGAPIALRRDVPRTKLRIEGEHRGYPPARMVPFALPAGKATGMNWLTRGLASTTLWGRRR